MFALSRRRTAALSRWLLMATCLAMAALTALPAAASDLSTIKQRGVLRVAVPQDFPPFGSVGPDMKLHGYDIDMARYLAKQMGVKVKLVPVTSANRIPFLQTDKVDLVISSLGKNPERAKVIDFSKAYAPFFLGVYGRPGSPTVKDAAGLAGKTIGVTRGSVEDMQLSQLAPKSTTIKRFEDNATTISAFLSGQVNYIATGNVVAAQIAERNKKRAPTIVFKIKNSPCYVGVEPSDQALLKRVNTLIEKARKSGKLESMSEKWFHAPLPADLRS